MGEEGNDAQVCTNGTCSTKVCTGACITGCALTYRKARQEKTGQEKGGEERKELAVGKYNQEKRKITLSKIVQGKSCLEGNYRLVQSTNYQDYLSAIGTTPLTAQMIQRSPVKISLAEDEDNSWVIQFETDMKVSGVGGRLRTLDKKVTRNRYRVGEEVKEMQEDWDRRDIATTLHIDREKTRLILHQNCSTNQALSSTLVIEMAESEKDVSPAEIHQEGSQSSIDTNTDLQEDNATVQKGENSGNASGEDSGNAKDENNAKAKEEDRAKVNEENSNKAKEENKSKAKEENRAKVNEENSYKAKDELSRTRKVSCPVQEGEGSGLIKMTSTCTSAVAVRIFKRYM